MSIRIGNKISSSRPEISSDFSWLEVPKSIWYFLDEDKKRFIWAVSILSAIFAYDLVPIFIVGKVVDFFAIYKPGQSLSTFYFYIIFITVTWITASLIRLKSKNMLTIIRLHARTRARTMGFERLTQFSLEWHNKENTGNKLQRIFTGAEAIVGWGKLFQKELAKIFINVMVIIVFFIFTNFKFGIIILIYIPLFFFLEFAFSKRIFKLSNEFNQLNQAASGVYMESAHNMLSIKALGGEKGVIGRVLGKETLSRDISIQKANSNNLKWRFIQFLNGVTVGVFLYFIGTSVVSGVITVGMVLILYSYFNKLQGYVADVSDLHAEMIDLKSELGQMMPIFKETEFIKMGNEFFPKEWEQIEIKDATMDYSLGQTGLRDFNLTLKRNTKTGVAGSSGSGKSTLAKIILGLYGLKLGEFKIGNSNYYSISHKETISHITVVLQETELFNLSLRDNITMMREESSSLLEMAIDISELKDVIAKLPEGLDSMIGEKGYMLSGGERQRLGIARAIYKNAPIIILDEATSSLDSETEGKIMAKLLGDYGKDKTFLIIAHRLGTLKYTDNIAVMEMGKVVEEGSYDALMENSDSVFHRMNKEQKNSNETGN